VVATAEACEDDGISERRPSESAFETVLESHLFRNGYGLIAREDFDRQRAIFPEPVLACIRATQRE
jgi:type I restriction enzyme R subunit